MVQNCDVMPRGLTFAQAGILVQWSTPPPIGVDQARGLRSMFVYKMVDNLETVKWLTQYDA
jgi:hypothetical protein